MSHVFNSARTRMDTGGGNDWCEEVWSLILAVNPLLTKTYNLSVCANQLPFTWLGHVFNSATTIIDTAAGNNSCDTIRTLILASNQLLTKRKKFRAWSKQLP